MANPYSSRIGLVEIISRITDANMVTDTYDLLVESCDRHNVYPRNLILTSLFEHSLDAYQKRLAEERGRLFSSNPKYAAIDFLDCFDGDSGKRFSICA